jgi:hypothetical protein
MRELPGCSGKRALLSKHAAHRVLAVMRDRTQYPPGVRLNAYRCMYCDLWHLGTSTVRERERIREKARATQAG